MLPLPTAIPEVIIIQPRVFEDSRGFFMETYEARRFAQMGISQPFVQDNHSGSRKGILRGMHYQIQKPQGKLVSVVAGTIFDVAVDIRRSSQTFGTWVGQVLSAENRLRLWVPVGFAHGFYVLSDWAEVIYKVTDYYAPEWERSILWNDPAIGIEWPIEPGTHPILAPRDAAGQLLQAAEVFTEV